MENLNIHEKKHQEYITNLKNKYSNYKSEYPVFWKLNAYSTYDLYVELPPTHPYFTKDCPEIKSDFNIINKFSKHHPTQAKCQFCKFYWSHGPEKEALEYLDLFASALKKMEIENKMEIDNEILHKAKKAKYNEKYFF